MTHIKWEGCNLPFPQGDSRADSTCWICENTFCFQFYGDCPGNIELSLIESSYDDNLFGNFFNENAYEQEILTKYL